MSRAEERPDEVEIPDDGYPWETWGGLWSAGAQSVEHADLSFRAAELLKASHPGCRPRIAVKVHIAEGADDRYVVPDVALFCGTDQRHPDASDVLLNPRVVVEVVSASSYERDKRTKVGLYLGIASVEAYILIESVTRAVTVHRREGPPSFGGMGFVEYRPGASLDIDALYNGIID